MSNYRLSVTSERKSAKEFFLDGLTYMEIGDKLKRNHTTIFKWSKTERWGTREKGWKKKACARNLLEKGKTLTRTAEIIGVSRQTLYNWGLSKKGGING